MSRRSGSSGNFGLLPGLILAVLGAGAVMTLVDGSLFQWPSLLLAVVVVLGATKKV